MSARFTGSGNIKVASGVKSVRITLNISWNDSQDQFGIGLSSASMNQEGKSFNWSRSKSNTSGSASRSFTLFAFADSSKEWSISYRKRDQDSTGNSGPESSTRPGAKNSDTRIVFYDGDGTDNNATITLSTSNVEFFTAGETPPPTTPGGGTDTIIDNTNGCPPGPWSQPVPPSCGSAPNALSSADGLQISKTGNSQITLNLRNYVNKLVTLKITHQVGFGTVWTQGFNFNIPNCSDISPNTGGTPYSKSGYSNGNISGTNIFYVYNVDGGDYNYVFNHSSVPGPAPWRQLYTKQCDTSCDDAGNCTTVCYCVAAGIEYFSPWPYCPVGVAVSKNGGDRVQWQYEDGGGGNYDDQYVTVEVVSVRNVIGATGSICTSALKNSVWISDPADTGANGNCISEYKDHSDKIRFRIPSLQQSKTSLPTPLCYSEFRGIAGAASPGEDLGSVSSEYSVLHLYNRDFLITTSLVTGSGIIVSAEGENDTYVSPYNEADPSLNANLGTIDRKHYLIQFTDGTVVDAGAGNIEVAIGQDVTAGGINQAPVFFKKEQVSANSLRVWFYLNYEQNQQQTDDIFHVFDDTANITDETLSKLNFSDVTITPQATDDPGNGTVGYETLDAINKKHYLVTFTDSTIVDANASNIVFEINQNKTASGDTFRINMVKRERVDDKNMRVWFTAYDPGAAAGLETDNTFVRDFSVNRTRVENFSGNVFARSWYLSKNV